MINFSKWKRIFPVNRTRVHPRWGNSYVEEWDKLEDFLRNRNGRVYPQQAFIDVIANLNLRSLYPEVILVENIIPEPSLINITLVKGRN
jgi:hypothetical protein